MSKGIALAAVGLVALSGGTALAQGQIAFTDIAVGGGAGLAYNRTRSESDVLFDLLKARPKYTFGDVIFTPIKSRGPGVL